MNIRLTPIIALTMALGIAACQEEENTEATETTGTEESGVAPADTNDAGSVTIIEPDDENASADAVAEEESEVEAGSTDMEETSPASTDGAIDGDQTDEPAATAAEPATDGIGNEGTADIEVDEED